MKISCAINTRKPNIDWLKQCLHSTKPFDEVICYVDGEPANEIEGFEKVEILGDGIERDIKDGFNTAIANTEGEWICSFCDDDYFIVSELMNLIEEIKAEKYYEADIIHFPVLTTAGRWGSTKAGLGVSDFEEVNCIPHGSFFRRKVWEKLGGYKVNACADWNFWLRAAKEGFKFKPYEKPVYFFRQQTGERSAYYQQLREHGSQALRRIVHETV